MALLFLDKAKTSNATTYARTIPTTADAKTPDASSRATLLSTMEMGMLREAGWQDPNRYEGQKTLQNHQSKRLQNCSRCDWTGV